MSSCRGVVPGGDHPNEPGQGRENAEGGCSQQRRLGALCGAAENEQTPYEEHEQHEGDADPEDPLYSVDSVCQGLVRRDGEHVARVGKNKRADELAGDGCRKGAGDCERRDPRPGTPLGKRQHQLDEERHPQRVEQEADSPQDMRVRPLKIRGE